MASYSDYTLQTGFPKARLGDLLQQWFGHVQLQSTAHLWGLSAKQQDGSDSEHSLHVQVLETSGAKTAHEAPSSDDRSRIICQKALWVCR